MVSERGVEVVDVQDDDSGLDESGLPALHRLIKEIGGSALW